MNPTWHAFNTDSLSKTHQIEEFPQDEVSETQLLYDLVFDSLGPGDVEPFRYTVTDGNVRMKTASEAPSAHFFPAATAFIIAIISEASSCLAMLPEALQADVIDYPDLFHQTGHDAFTTLKTTKLTPPATLSHVLAALDSNQVLADSVEAITSTIGLQLVAEIGSGWRYADVETERTKPILLLHSLRLIEPFTIPSFGYHLEVAGVINVMPAPKETNIFDRLMIIDHFVDASHIHDHDAIVSVSINADGKKLVGNMSISDLHSAVLLWDENYENMMGTLTVERTTVGDLGLKAFNAWGSDEKLGFGALAGAMIGKKVLGYFKDAF